MPVLIFSMTTSLDGYVTDREGGIGWSSPSDELFLFHHEQVRGLGAYLCGRRLYETMLPWETDPALSASEAGRAFAETWNALPKVVFSRTLDSVQGNARLARKPLAEEVAEALGATDKDVSIGGADLAGAAVELGLVDEFRMFRAAVVIGGGTPYFRPVTDNIALELIETRTFGAHVIYERYRRLSS